MKNVGFRKNTKEPLGLIAIVLRTGGTLGILRSRRDSHRLAYINYHSKYSDTIGLIYITLFSLFVITGR